MKSSNLSGLINRLRDKARRLSRIDGSADEIHDVLLTAHRAMIAQNPVGQNRNLGPSITNPNHPNHVFSVNANNRIEFGTDVVYAQSYNERTKRDIVLVNEDIKSGIKTAIVKYVGLK